MLVVWVTSAFAYQDRFGNTKPEDVADNAVLNLLTRGLKESLLDYISNANSGDALKVFIYEFHDIEVAKELKAAKLKGVKLHIIYDAGKVKSKERNEHLLGEVGWKGFRNQGLIFKSVIINLWFI